MTYSLTPWTDDLPPYVTAARMKNIPPRLDARMWGVVGDNSTDNATPLANFAAAVRDAGPGATGILPPGTILTSGPLQALGDGSFFQGHGMNATTLKKTGNFDLVTMSGTAGSPDTSLRWFCGLRDMTLEGAHHSGRLLDVVYAAGHIYEKVRFAGNWGTANTEPGVDLVQVWDSRFNHCWFDDVTPSDGSMPAMYIRCSRATSGFGNSSDSSNQIHVNHCNFVSNKGPDLRVGKGGASVGTPTDPNQIYIETNKFESQYIRANRLITDSSCHDVHIQRAFINLVNFDSGYSTAVQGISWQGAEFCTLKGIWIMNAGVATVSEGIWMWPGADNMMSVDEVWGNYGTAPTTGNHISIAGGTMPYMSRVDALNVTNVVAGAGYTNVHSPDRIRRRRAGNAKATPTYSASITIDSSAGRWQTITVTNTTAFTLNAPTYPPGSGETNDLTVEIYNNSGGAMGAITWNAAFLFTGQAWANPANTKRRCARFQWNGTNWIATYVSSADY